jgi:predicted amidohydrolase YtcJ
MHHPGSRLRWAGLKRFADGSLGGHTAAMHEPFSDDPDENGMLRLTAVEEELARASLEMGGTVAIHAIGDLACTRVLDLFEKLVGEGIAGHRLRLEHASVLTAGDIGRLARLGVIASVQPAFMASETRWLEKRVGPDRLLRTYPLGSLESAGVALAGGSDCPVEPPDPWAGIALARDRAGIVPAEALSAESAFRLFTSGGALALGEPEPLAAGSPADFLIVDRDPVTSTPDEVRATKVIDTWIGGEPVAVDRSIPTWNE